MTPCFAVRGDSWWKIAQNYCETIVCSVIKSVSALQLLQDIMIHVSLSSCSGCPRELVEICTYCFPFSSLFPLHYPYSLISLVLFGIWLQKFCEIQSCTLTHINLWIHTHTHRYGDILPFSKNSNTIKHCILQGTFCNYEMHKVRFLGWWFLTQEAEVKGEGMTNV